MEILLLMIMMNIKDFWNQQYWLDILLELKYDLKVFVCKKNKVIQVIELLVLLMVK